MTRDGLSQRIWIAASLLAVTFIFIRSASHGEQMAPRKPLQELPSDLGDWRGRELPIEERIVKATGSDDYTSRIYQRQDGAAVGLYIGYYGSQRTGDWIHSPKNCLPGLGWQPVRAGLLRIIAEPGFSIEVNEYIVEKGLERQLVAYWYQGRGRVIASEYWGKFWMVADSITRHRTDAALVRVVAPLSGSEEETRRHAIEFIQQLFPHLRQHIPD